MDIQVYFSTGANCENFMKSFKKETYVIFRPRLRTNHGNNRGSFGVLDNHFESRIDNPIFLFPPAKNPRQNQRKKNAGKAPPGFEEGTHR